MLIVLGLAGIAAAAGRPRLPGSEAPRATDLLRAETLSRQAEQRLKLPARRGGGWQAGGARWGTRERTPVERAPSIIIRTTPPRKRPAR